MSFNIHLKKNSVVHSDRSNHVYLNPLSDSRIRSPWCGFSTGSDEECGGVTCSRQGSQVTLGRSIYYISYYLIYLSSHDSPFSVFILIWAGGVYGANEGGDNNGGRLVF